MKSAIPPWAIAVGFGVFMALNVLKAAVGDGGGWADVNLSEWIGVAIGFLGGAWAKFSNPEKVLSHKPTITIQ
jgi:hypothetical protein